jgi:activator of HSP90 ATPase
MASEFTISTTIPASPKEIYAAWLSSKGHAAMTGSPARVSANVGGKFFAWDGYISGTNLELTPHRRIVQAWRTTEFAATDPDSQIDITLEKAPGGTKLTLRHTGIPAGQSDYKSGWTECYFDPMKQYFTAAKKAATLRPT